MALVSVIQMNANRDVERNIARAEELVRAAARAGAVFVATPENTPFLGPQEEKVRRAEGLDGPTCQRFGALARELSIHLLLGSFGEASPVAGRCYNTSVLFGPGGQVMASYRKIHLFDVDLSPELRTLESETVAPGEAVVTVDIPAGRLGLSICYDLRFPELYQALRREGATVLTVPAAFTLTTGKDHWEVLLRARAIETQCYLLAPAQVGRHDDEGLRESYGHAMIVDPWGQVIASVSDGEGFCLARIEPERVERVRRQIPVMAHKKL